MSLEILKKDLEQKNFRRIYYLYGPEPYLKRFYLKSLIDAILPHTKDADLHRYEGKDLTVDVFSEELWLCPMGEYKVMQISDLPASSSVTEFLASQDCEIGDDTVVIVYQQTETPDGRTSAFKALKKRLEKDGLLVEIKTVDEQTLIRWVSQQFRRRGCDISADDVDFFLAVEEPNMESMLTEIDKIAAYCGNTVTRDALEKLCVRSLQARVYDLNDRILDKNSDGVFSIWNDLRAQRVPAQMILGNLYSCFAGLYRLKLLEKEPESVRVAESEMKDFLVRRYSRRLPRLSLSGLDRLMDLCAETDLQMKTGKVDEDLLVVRLLTEAMEAL
ncbi:MAG: DNA polymerase III subunit delta [Clostridia bacterium]|nr:DNA polymerase III subunit delta [Clostridia bacterium]